MRARKFQAACAAVFMFLMIVSTSSCNPDTGLIVYKEGAMDGYTLINVIDVRAFVVNMLGKKSMSILPSSVEV